MLLEIKPDYTKCPDDRKETYWNVCKHSKKGGFVICTFTGDKCPAWSDYNDKITLLS